MGSRSSLRRTRRSATPPAACPYVPDPIWAEGTFYSPTKAEAVYFDGACFANRQWQESVDVLVGGPATPLNGCHEEICGPIGTYCYTRLDGLIQVSVVQPLYRPSPFISFKDDPFTCYALGGTVVPPAPPDVPSEVEEAAQASSFSGGELTPELPPIAAAQDFADQESAFLSGDLVLVPPEWSPDGPNPNPECGGGLVTNVVDSAYGWGFGPEVDPNGQLDAFYLGASVEILQAEIANAIEAQGPGYVLVSVSPLFWHYDSAEAVHRSALVKISSGNLVPGTAPGENTILFNGCYFLARQLCFQAV
jgi:hypothetical protein